MKKLGTILESFDQDKVLELIAQIDAAMQAMQGAVASVKVVEQELRANGLTSIAEKLTAVDWSTMESIKEELRKQAGGEVNG